MCSSMWYLHIGFENFVNILYIHQSWLRATDCIQTNMCNHWIYLEVDVWITHTVLGVWVVCPATSVSQFNSVWLHLKNSNMNFPQWCNRAKTNINSKILQRELYGNIARDSISLSTSCPYYVGWFYILPYLWGACIVEGGGVGGCWLLNMALPFCWRNENYEVTGIVMLKHNCQFKKARTVFKTV